MALRTDAAIYKLRSAWASCCWCPHSVQLDYNITSITITALQHCCGVINTTLLWLLSTGTLSWQRQWSYATAECQSTKPLTCCADDINVIHSMSTADTTALCTIPGFTSNQGAFVSRWVLCLGSACNVESVKHAKLFCKLACSPMQILFVSLWGGCNTLNLMQDRQQLWTTVKIKDADLGYSSLMRVNEQDLSLPCLDCASVLLFATQYLSTLPDWIMHDGL